MLYAFMEMVWTQRMALSMYSGSFCTVYNIRRYMRLFAINKKKKINYMPVNLITFPHKL